MSEEKKVKTLVSTDPYEHVCWCVIRVIAACLYHSFIQCASGYGREKIEAPAGVAELTWVPANAWPITLKLLLKHVNKKKKT